jgi:hypothetical protein
MTMLAQLVAGCGLMSCARRLPWPLVSGRLKDAKTQQSVGVLVPRFRAGIEGAFLAGLLPASTVALSMWTRFIDRDGSIAQGGAIQPRDGVARAFFARHLDKAKAFALAAITIDDDMHINHFPVPAEQLRQLGMVSRIGEVSNINAGSHVSLAFSQAGRAM